MKLVAWLPRLALLAALATAGLPAVAQDNKAPDPEKTFKRKDTNGDKKVSLEEFKAGSKPKS